LTPVKTVKGLKAVYLCDQHSDVGLQKVGSGASQTGVKQSSSAALSTGQRAPVSDVISGAASGSEELAADDAASKASTAARGSAKPAGQSL